ncbi:MAG TPA: precorrin-6y C5,15-methyltransferase (decarboxylating) subunit CbiE [Candidatus Limnocylindrales bacterium]|nr:precorrin-6y C5,15-methyltransferase (decarboxylating) subunit CbiE [Candidatus Limnocylindrales bacterium]
MISIIGITDAGPAGLPVKVLDRIQSAEVLCGGERHLALFSEVKPKHSIGFERWLIKNNLAELTQYLKQEATRKQIVVLASGDPNFYGIGSYLSRHLPKDWIEIFPNVTTVQLAFARIKESWQDAVVVSVHGRPIDPIIEVVRRHPKVAIFTDPDHTPGVVAKALLAAGISKRRAVVCEHLDGVQERIVETTLEALPDQSFDPLNILILLDERGREEEEKRRESSASIYPISFSSPAFSVLGIPDTEFTAKKGLMTRQEIRVISLAKLQLREDSIVWDIGAGSGSLSIEASRIAREGKIFAVEKDEECIRHIRNNCAKFGITRINLTEGWAPEACRDWPSPDAVFIGGSGGKMKEILDMIFSRLRPNGHLVLNLISLERLYEVMERLRAQGWIPEITQVSIARSKEILDMTRLVPLDPVFIVSARNERPGDIEARGPGN